jgi:hypothetical protein
MADGIISLFIETQIAMEKETVYTNHFSLLTLLFSTPKARNQK